MLPEDLPSCSAAALSLQNTERLVETVK